MNDFAATLRQSQLANSRISREEKPNNSITVYEWLFHIIDAKNQKTLFSWYVNEVYSFSWNKSSADTFQMLKDRWYIETELSAEDIHNKIMSNEWKLISNTAPKTVSLSERTMLQTQNSVDSILMRSLLNANPGAKKYMN